MLQPIIFALRLFKPLLLCAGLSGCHTYVLRCTGLCILPYVVALFSTAAVRNTAVVSSRCPKFIFSCYTGLRVVGSGCGLVSELWCDVRTDPLLTTDCARYICHLHVEISHV